MNQNKVKRKKKKKIISLFGEIPDPSRINNTTGRAKVKAKSKTVDIGNIKNHTLEPPDLSNPKVWFKKFYRLGHDEFQKKSYEKSLTYFSHLRNSIEENPDAFGTVSSFYKKSLFVCVGLCLRNLQSFEESLRFLEISESIEPTEGFEHAKSLQERATTLLCLSRKKEAISVFFEALDSSNGVLSKTIESIWTYYQDEGDEETGLKFLHDLTKKYPKQFYVYTLLGKYYYEISYFNQAIKIFRKHRKGKKLPQDYFITLWERARWYFRNKDYMNSLKDYEEILEHQESSYIYYERGKVLEKIGEFELALEDFKKCLGFGSEETGLYYHCGNCYYYTGNYKRALKCYLLTEKKYLNNPNSKHAKSRMFILYFTIGKTLQLLDHNKRALEYLFKALHEKKSSLERKSDLFYEIGVVHEKLSLENEAISFYQKSLDVYNKKKLSSTSKNTNYQFRKKYKDNKRKKIKDHDEEDEGEEENEEGEDDENEESPMTPISSPPSNKSKEERNCEKKNRINLLSCRRLAVIYYRRKRFKQALFYFRKLTEIKPSSSSEKEEITERDVECFSNQKNRKMFVTRVENLMNVGICLQKLQRYEEAIEAYHQFLKEKKRLVQFFVKRVEVQQKEEEEEKKSKDKKIGRRRRKNHHNIIPIPSYCDPKEFFGNSEVHHASTRLAKEHIALCLTYLNQFQKALKMLDEVDTTTDGPGLSEEGFYVRGKIYEKMGVERLMNEFVEKADRPDKVIEGYNMVLRSFADFQNVIEKNPRKIDTYVHLGYLCRRMGMYPEVFINNGIPSQEYQNRALKNFLISLNLLKEERDICTQQFQKKYPVRFQKVMGGGEEVKVKKEEEEEEEEGTNEEETIYEKKLGKIRSKKNFVRGMVKRIFIGIESRNPQELKELKKLYGSTFE